jgi:hypothetical protein
MRGSVSLCAPLGWCDISYFYMLNMNHFPPGHAALEARALAAPLA